MAEHDVVMTAAGPTLPMLSEELELAGNSVAIVDWRDRQGVIGSELPVQDVDHLDSADEEDHVETTQRLSDKSPASDHANGAPVRWLWDWIWYFQSSSTTRCGGQASVALLH